VTDVRFKREMDHLLRLKTILDSDTILPLRFDVEPLSLDLRRSKITIKGIRSLTGNPDQTAACTGDRFTITMEVPQGYPWNAIPNIRFGSPVPFHPHVWTNGGICWGTANAPQPDRWLADWFRGVVEYLQYNQDPVSMLRINPDSPANSSAMVWWQSKGSSISRYVTSIDMSRLRFWIDQLR